MQNEYFPRYDSFEESLMAAIKASGHEMKEVAMHLWRNTNPNTAYQRLIEALNPGKAQKLSVYEMLSIMHFCGRYDPLMWIADECLHLRPEPKSIEREAQDMQHLLDQMMIQVKKSYETFNSLVDRRKKIEELQKDHPMLKCVKEAK